MPSGSEDHEDKVTKWAKVKASHIDKIAMLVGQDSRNSNHIDHEMD